MRNQDEPEYVVSEYSGILVPWDSLDAATQQFILDAATKQLSAPKHRDYVAAALDIAWHIYCVDRGIDPEHATDDQRADFLVACARAINFDLADEISGVGGRSWDHLDAAIERAGEHG